MATDIAFIRGKLIQNNFDTTAEYPELVEYIKNRIKAHGLSCDIKLFLRKEFFRKIPNAVCRVSERIDPTTDETFYGDWDSSTRAFFNKESNSIYLDFQMESDSAAKLNKTEHLPFNGWEKCDKLIDFFFTLEHELTHVEQEKKMQSGEISFDTLQLSKSHIAIRYISACNGGERFYDNAHDDLFLERDANSYADEFLSNAIFLDNFGYTIANPDDPKECQHDMSSILLNRIKQGQHFNKKHNLFIENYPLGLSVHYNGTTNEVVNMFCDDIIKRFPDYLLKSYPTLCLEYQPSGERKSDETINKILTECDKTDTMQINGQQYRSNKIKRIYEKIIKQRTKPSIANEKAR
jgi:hypothetical protein